MDVFSLMQTVAQIAVAFAGFGALANSINTSSSTSLIQHNQLRTMVESSLIVMTLALAPCGLALFDMSEEVLWRASSVLALCLFLPPIPGALRRVQHAAATAGFPWFAFAATSSLGVGALGLFLLGALSAPLAGNFAATYFAGLLAILIVEGILFSRLVLYFLSPAKEK